MITGGHLAHGITHIYSFLVRPEKGRPEKDVIGTQVELEGELFAMLSKLYAATDAECKIDIRFMPKDDTQSNDTRELFISLIKSLSFDLAEMVAKNLQKVTTKSSGIGLLFILIGKESKGDKKTKLIISRFPADEAILASEEKGKLSVAVLKQVFLRNVHAYKAVAYRNLTSTSDVWNGSAVDRQIDNFNSPTSKYWIKDFLQSDFSITPKHGTTRLAEAIRKAANLTSDLKLKEQITAAAILLPQFDGKAISIETALDALPLTEEAKEAIRTHTPGAIARRETFFFDRSVYEGIVTYKSVVLNTGVLVSADANNFDELVEVTQEGKQTRFSTKGIVVNQKLQKQGGRGAL